MEDFTAALPAELHTAYRQSCEQMTPTVMRHAFGLVDLAYADDESGSDGEFNPQTDLGRQARKLALDAARDWEGIHRSHWSSMADQSVDKRSAFLRSAQHAKSTLERSDAAFEAFMRPAEQRAEHLAKLMANACEPPTNVGAAMIDSETRALIRATANPDEARAIAERNPRAVATLPEAEGAALLTPSGYSAIRRAHLKATIPDTYAESQELSRALNVAARCTTELTKRARKMIDFDSAERMAKHADWKPYTPPVTAETAAQYAAGRRAA